jgi:hypothetical protein
MNCYGSGFIPILIYQTYSEQIAGSDDFLLLSGEDFLLLDGTNFLLLGS